MKLLATFVAAVLLLLVPTAANAKTDVTGSPEHSDVHIKVIKFLDGHPESTSKPSGQTPKNDGIPNRKLRCMDQVDGTTYCFGMGAVPPPAKPGAPTDGEILTAIKKIGLPRLEINIQPNDETLVNFDTIFFARPQPFRRNVNLLDYDIDLVATPVGFTWHHGDGTSHTTSKPGAPYPSKGVTYRYQKSAQNLRPSVDVTYTVRYRVDGGAWQNLSQTLQASGPTGDLDVSEATPVLAHY